MRILALDLGTKTGWALSEDKKVIASGTWDLKGDRFEGAGMRFIRFEKHIEKIAPEQVYYEAVSSHKGTIAAHVYGGLMAMLQACCEKNKIPYQGIPVATIKRFATGKGNSKKDVMMAAARLKFPLASPKMDDNEADALWIATLINEDYAAEKEC